jgi:hypothetical protein
MPRLVALLVAAASLVGIAVGPALVRALAADLTLFVLYNRAR